MFDSKRVPILFLRVKFKVDQGGNKMMTLDFAIPRLKEGHSLPTFLREVAAGLINAPATQRAVLNRVMGAQHMYLYASTTAPEPMLELKNVDLSRMQLDRDEGLLFSVEKKFDNLTAYCAADNYGKSLFVIIEDAQTELKITIEETKERVQ